jgi:hypothetical protein
VVRSIEPAVDADVIISDWEEMIDEGSTITTGSHRAIDWPALKANAELATTAALLYRRSIVECIDGLRPDLPVQDARFLFERGLQRRPLCPSARRQDLEVDAESRLD